MLENPFGFHHRVAHARRDRRGLDSPHLVINRHRQRVPGHRPQVAHLAQIHVVEQQLACKRRPRRVGLGEYAITVRHNHARSARGPDLGQTLAQVILAKERQRRGIEESVAQLDLDRIGADDQLVRHLEAVRIDHLGVVGPPSQKLRRIHPDAVDAHARVAQDGDREHRRRGHQLKLECAAHDMVAVTLVVIRFRRLIDKRLTRNPTGVEQIRLHGSDLSGSYGAATRHVGSPHRLGTMKSAAA